MEGAEETLDEATGLRIVLQAITRSQLLRRLETVPIWQAALLMAAFNAEHPQLGGGIGGTGQLTTTPLTTTGRTYEKRERRETQATA